MSERERVRLFVALELPDLVRDALVEWRPSARGLRLVDPAALHVTLCFFGSRHKREIPPILDACAVASGLPAGSLSIEEALWLPQRRPRVLAMRLTDDGGRLAAAQAKLSEALSAGVGTRRRRAHSWLTSRSLAWPGTRAARPRWS